MLKTSHALYKRWKQLIVIRPTARLYQSSFPNRNNRTSLDCSPTFVAPPSPTDSRIPSSTQSKTGSTIQDLEAIFKTPIVPSPYVQSRITGAGSFDWRRQLASLQKSPVDCNAQKLANVLKNIHFSHPDEVTELIRDWSDLLGQVEDRNAWDVLFQRASSFGDDGWRAAWEGYVRCGDRGFAVNEFVALFLFQCSSLLYSSSQGYAWMVQQYRDHMLPSPYRTNSPAGDSLFRLWQSSPSHFRSMYGHTFDDSSSIAWDISRSHQFLAELWYDMLGPSIRLRSLLESFWLSRRQLHDQDTAKPLMRMLNAKACFSILELSQFTRDIDTRLLGLDFCLQVLKIGSNTMTPNKQTKIIKVILDNCRELVGRPIKKDGSDDWDFSRRRDMFLPVVERADRLIRSYKLDSMGWSDQLGPSLMSAYDICYRHDKVIEIWHELRAKNTINNRVTTVLLDSCGCHGNKILALSTWSALRNEGLPLDKISWAAYRECLGRLGEWQMVVDIICIEMKNRQGDPPAPYPTAEDLARVMNQWTWSTQRNSKRGNMTLYPASDSPSAAVNHFQGMQRNSLQWINVRQILKQEFPELFLEATIMIKKHLPFRK